MRLKAIPVFLAMGLADAIGPFGRLAKDGYQLSNVKSLNPSAGFRMFGLLNGLLLTCALSILGLLGLFTPNQGAGLFLTGIGFASIFPLVFFIAVEALPQHTNELTGLMVTAIGGGAFLPPLMGLVADRSSVQWSFLVPLAAILYIPGPRCSTANRWRPEPACATSLATLASL